MKKVPQKSQYVKNGKGVGHRYPKEYQQRVVDWVGRRQKRHDSGSVIAEAMRHFDIPYYTILRWVGGAGSRSRPKVDRTKLLAVVQKDFTKAVRVFEKIARMIG